MRSGSEESRFADQIEKYAFPESMIEWYMEVDKLSSMFSRREKIVKNEVNNK